jgi:glycosyltransferase involved in cell wall biosynthesis
LAVSNNPEEENPVAKIADRILYVQYTNPAGYPPLEHSSQIFSSTGWEVLFLGTGAFGADVLVLPIHPNIIFKQIPFSPAGWQQKLHYAWFCLWVVIWTLKWKPQWIYASDILSCPASYLISFLPNIQMLYHEHDSPHKEATSLFMKVCLMTRKSLAKKASACIVPNQERLETFIKATVGKTSEKMFCVWNCPNRGEIFTERSPKTDNNLWLLYHGSIVPQQLPETIIQAMAKLPKNIKLKIVGYETIGHIGYVKYLQELASKLGIGKQINYIGPVPTRLDLLRQCQSCDVGLSLFPLMSIQPMTGASNKPFDYLACGLPLLVSNLPDWREMYVEPGYGLTANPDDPENIAAALRWYLEHPKEMREMGEQGRQRILKEWNYEHQFEKVENLLKHKLST